MNKKNLVLIIILLAVLLVAGLVFCVVLANKSDNRTEKNEDVVPQETVDVEFTEEPQINDVETNEETSSVDTNEEVNEKNEEETATQDTEAEKVEQSEPEKETAPKETQPVETIPEVTEGLGVEENGAGWA